ncbi:hypothetical protein Sjap_002689 [Stephania japonica]|uniref:Uncharacterized protein n=1 Tax=Stephania japonica TaxID=461633 RepID=A0AAP0KP34_9MAGN
MMGQLVQGDFYMMRKGMLFGGVLSACGRALGSEERPRVGRTEPIAQGFGGVRFPGSCGSGWPTHVSVDAAFQQCLR